jgi:hypothetical protein
MSGRLAERKAKIKPADIARGAAQRTPTPELSNSKLRLRSELRKQRQTHAHTYTARTRARALRQWRIVVCVGRSACPRWFIIVRSQGRKSTPVESMQPPFLESSFARSRWRTRPTRRGSYGPFIGTWSGPWDPNSPGASLPL